MFPLKDLNRPLRIPHVNRMLLIINIIIFVVYWVSYAGIYFSSDMAKTIENEFTMYPREIVHGERLYTLVTSMFMHANWLHLFGNMLYLYIFGDNVEDVFGHGSYLIFYIVCGLTAAYSHIVSLYLGLTYPTDFKVGVVGASGAVSGVLGAYFILYPKARILTWIVYYIFPIPAIIFLGFWFLMQWLYGLYDIGSGVAYWAHVGGFVAGMVLAVAFGLKRKRKRMANFRF